MNKKYVVTRTDENGRSPGVPAGCCCKTVVTSNARIKLTRRELLVVNRRLASVYVLENDLKSLLDFGYPR